MVVRIRAVVFDMDGVVVETSELDFQTDKKVFASVGIEMTKDRYHKRTGQTSRQRYEEETAAEGVKADIDAMQQLRNVEMKRVLAGLDLQVSDGFHDLVERIRSAGMRVALATSSRSVKTDMVLEKLKLKDFFDVEINGDSIQNNKPAPDVYLKALEKLELQPHEVVAVEDSETGIRSAKAAGVFCIALATELTKHQDQSRADTRVSSLKDISVELIESMT